MRVTPVALVLASVLFMSSSVSVGQNVQPIAPLSQSFAARGASALATRNYEAATDAFETAVAIDPRNRNAYMGLAEIARVQGLPGKAIHYYGEMLTLDPNDNAALAGQGMAMLDKGALASARDVLERLKSSCRAPCASAQQLAGAIANSAQTRVVAKSDVKPDGISANE